MRFDSDQYSTGSSIAHLCLLLRISQPHSRLDRTFRYNAIIDEDVFYKIRLSSLPRKLRDHIYEYLLIIVIGIEEYGKICAQLLAISSRYHIKYLAPSVPLTTYTISRPNGSIQCIEIRYTLRNKRSNRASNVPIYDSEKLL